MRQRNTATQRQLNYIGVLLSENMDMKIIDLDLIWSFRILTTDDFSQSEASDLIGDLEEGWLETAANVIKYKLREHENSPRKAGNTGTLNEKAN